MNFKELCLKNKTRNQEKLHSLGFHAVAQSPIFQEINNLSNSSFREKKSGRRRRKESVDSPYRRITRSCSNRMVASEQQSADDETSGSEGTSGVSAPRQNAFGAILGVSIGHIFETRLECSRAGVHRPTVAGIHGCKEGCYSVALSGGYDDDRDFFFTFEYTGSGGRDLKGTKSNPKNLRTAPQSKDQELNHSNYSLTVSVKNGNPVRVIRGYKLNSKYAPEEGYRYDGLYKVEKWWTSIGVTGYLVYKFLFKRCEDQEIPSSVARILSNEKQS